MTDQQDMRLLIVVMAKNEESQLDQTVRGLQNAGLPEQAAGMVILLAQYATEGCLRTAEALQNEGFSIPVEAVRQPVNNLPVSIQIALNDRSHITHFLYLAADYFLESEAIAGLIARAVQDRGSIYKVSRALPGGSFSPHYSGVQVLLYRSFCTFVRVLFNCNITDPVFSSLVAPVQLFCLFRPKQTTLAFCSEWMFALLRKKVAVTEIPVVNLPRTEQEGTSTVFSRLRYVKTALRARFVPMKRLWDEDALQ